jgi:membrane-bound inhibitor of C-type lysozyme
MNLQRLATAAPIALSTALLAACAAPQQQAAPVRFSCSDGSSFDATFLRTDPPSLVARRGERSLKMQAQTAASGARYAGEGASFWEHQGEAMVSWGPGSAQLPCKKAG